MIFLLTAPSASRRGIVIGCPVVVQARRQVPEALNATNNPIAGEC